MWLAWCDHGSHRVYRRSRCASESGRTRVTYELTTRDELIFDHLCSRVRSLVQEKSDLANTCVLSTRIGVEVLRYFDYDPKPQPCYLVIYNEAYADWIDNNKQPPM